MHTYGKCATLPSATGESGLPRTPQMEDEYHRFHPLLLPGAFSIGLLKRIAFVHTRGLFPVNVLLMLTL